MIPKKDSIYNKEFLVKESEPAEIIIDKIDDYLMDLRAELYNKLMTKRLNKIMVNVDIFEKER